MAWRAFTFDGLDTAFADAEFTDQMDSKDTSLTPESSGGPGVVTQVNAPLVQKFMNAVTPHLQKAVAEGVNDAVVQHKQKLTLGAVAVGGTALLALVFLWKMSSRLQECCPARPVSGYCEGDRYNK
jgi:hypothetical protein